MISAILTAASVADQTVVVRIARFVKHSVAIIAAASVYCKGIDLSYTVTIVSTSFLAVIWRTSFEYIINRSTPAICD